MAFLKKALNKKMRKSDYTQKEYWFSKIKSRKLATELIRQGSIVFFGVAGILLVIGYFISNKDYETGVVFMMISVVYAILVGILFKWKSRVAAVLIFIIMFDALISMNGSIILTLLLFWFSIRLVQATFKLHSKNK